MADWTQAEKYYDSGNTAGFAMSMLESERLFRQAIADKKIPGQSLDEKIEHSRKYLSSPQIFEQARFLVLQLVNLQFPANISKQTAEQILRVYYTAVSDVENIGKAALAREYLSHRFKGIAKLLVRTLSFLAIAAALLIVGTFYLEHTESGLRLGEKLITISDFIIYKALPALGIVLTVAIIAIGFSLNRSRRKHHAAVQHQAHAEPENKSNEPL